MSYSKTDMLCLVFYKAHAPSVCEKLDKIICNTEKLLILSLKRYNL